MRACVRLHPKSRSGVVQSPAASLFADPQEMGEGKYTVVFFDLGGSSSMRKTWRSYLAEVHGVIFVVDAAAPARFAEAATTLSGLLESEQMKGKPLLVRGGQLVSTLTCLWVELTVWEKLCDLLLLKDQEAKAKLPLE